ncbi:hypothetical protein [Phytopseudomonas punonensis]|uniref:Bacteriophage Rz lysis protein n=1 Tax=Phytopseudomonas punonensis TaxID=1220495 RepID=A0A1M7KNZ1_9GAMM|nr:hypothetical protein [Pseudomonas punonensis]SHM66894.1 hypothetical protein SAMN05216288_4062 [Pseudomonas punonensis]
MSLLALIPARLRLPITAVLALTLLFGAASLGWVVQGWRMGESLAERDKTHAQTLGRIQSAAALETQRANDKRLMLEQQLQASSQIRYRKLTDAEDTAARLRDRLATAELRLSVLTATSRNADAGHDARLSTTTAAGRLVDGAERANIDRGAAQQIVAITGRGDRAIIALGMCQAYVQAISQEG